MVDEVRTSKRDLIARVATLELLVADLVHILWQVSPGAMNRLAAEAARDLEIGDTRIALPVGDHQGAGLRIIGYLDSRLLKPKKSAEAA